MLKILLVLLLLAPISGELYRVPFMGFDLLPSDILIPILFVAWIIDKIRNDRLIRLGRVGKFTVIYLLILAFTFVLNAFRFPLSEMAVGGAYMARYGMYVVLSLIVYDLLARDATKRLLKIIVASSGISAMIIAVFGFLQLKYFPDFLSLGLYLQGWDPHIGRLASTWLDPNFISGMLAFILAPVAALGIHFHRKKEYGRLIGAFAVFGILLVALYLTYSRSGYLAFLAGLGLLAFLKSRKLLIATVLTVVLLFLFTPRVQERVGEAWDSGKAFLGLDSQWPLDPTAQLRVFSWQFGREIVADYPILGMGWRYKYEINNRGHGLLSDHSSGGSDSSLLTLWANSGIFGLLSFLGIGAAAFYLAFKRLWHHDDFYSFLEAGLISGFFGLLVHSVFLNSLFYPLVIVYLSFALGMLDRFSSAESESVRPQGAQGPV
jgi:O-antigen ligase